MADSDRKQIDITAKLQLALLENFDKILSDGTITPTDRATLARLLMANGWNLDPSKLPEGIKDKLTTLIRPEDLNDDDADVGGAH